MFAYIKTVHIILHDEYTFRESFVRKLLIQSKTDLNGIRTLGVSSWTEKLKKIHFLIPQAITSSRKNHSPD